MKKNEGKSVVAERFVRTLKNRIFMHMTDVSKKIILMFYMILLMITITYHRTIKVKPIDIKPDSYAEYNVHSNEKDPKFQVHDHIRISKYKDAFAKRYTSRKRFCNTVPWTYVIGDLNGANFIGTFYNKELRKTNQKEFRIEKVIKRKGNKLYVTWKSYYNSVNSWIDKKRHCIKISQYFPKSYRSFKANIKVELDLASYERKAELKNAAGVDTSNLAAKSYLAHLKAEVHKIDVDKLKTLPVDLSKISHLVRNEVVEKTKYEKLVTKVNNIDTCGFVLKTKYDTEKSDLESKISETHKKFPNTSGLVKKTDYNSKISKIEGKILSGLATNSALTAAENKIPVSSLVKKIRL